MVLGCTSAQGRNRNRHTHKGALAHKRARSHTRMHARTHARELAHARARNTQPSWQVARLPTLWAATLALCTRTRCSHTPHVVSAGCPYARTHGHPRTVTRQGCTHTHTHLAFAPEGEGQAALAAPCKEEPCARGKQRGTCVHFICMFWGLSDFVGGPGDGSSGGGSSISRPVASSRALQAGEGGRMPWQRHAAAREGLQTRWKRNKREHCSSKQAAFAAVRNQVQPSRMPAGRQQCSQQAAATMNSNSPLMKIAGSGAAGSVCNARSKDIAATVAAAAAPEARPAASSSTQRLELEGRNQRT